MSDEAFTTEAERRERTALRADDIARLPELSRRYAGAGPRYTSYPTAVEFRGAGSARAEGGSDRGVDEHVFARELAADLIERRSYPGARPQELPISLYVHLPFCHSLCYFCACNKIITRDESVTRPYLDLVEREMTLYRDQLGDRPFETVDGSAGGSIEQIHWGGGTPNFLTPDEMRWLHGTTKRLFPHIGAKADVSVELDPRVCTSEHLDVLREIGFNRVSLGVQDFDPVVQELVHRIQPYEQTRDLIAEARSRGFGSVNVDLIYGLPGQSLDGFTDTLERIIEIRPERVALYGYAHVTWIRKVQKALERAHLPLPDERITLFVRALELFTAAGYRYIGMDHFALPEDTLATALDNGKLNRNFMGYSTHRGSRILGFGVSSISTLPSAYAQNTKDIDVYRARVSSGALPIERGVLRTEDDMVRGEIIEQLLCVGMIDMKSVEDDWGIDFEKTFPALSRELCPFIDDGLVVLDGSTLRLTPVGRIFSRNVAMLFDAYLAAHRERSRPTFSQTV